MGAVLAQAVPESPAREHTGESQASQVRVAYRTLLLSQLTPLLSGGYTEAAQ